MGCKIIDENKRINIDNEKISCARGIDSYNSNDDRLRGWFISSTNTN